MNQLIHLLLIEDNNADIEALKRGLSGWSHPHILTVAQDVPTALNILRTPDPRQRRPDLILLDLNLPGRSGLEFLRELRADPQLRRMVVSVWSVSVNPADIAACYDQLVAGYVTKVKDNSAQNLLTLLSHYCELVQFPPTVPG